MPSRSSAARRRTTRRRRLTSHCGLPRPLQQARAPSQQPAFVKVLISLTDVEPAVRINAELERAGVETAVVSPLDDVRGAIRRENPDVIVMTGGLIDPQNVALVREMLWEGVAVVGLADVRDPEIDDRLRSIGFAEVHAKPIVVSEVADAIRRLLDRRRLASLTGLIGQSESIREVLVKVEQIAPVSSTVLIEGESGTG